MSFSAARQNGLKSQRDANGIKMDECNSMVLNGVGCGNGGPKIV